MTKWRDLTGEQRDGLLARRNGGEIVEDIARKVGIRSETLSRRLREHAARYSSKQKDNEPGGGESISFEQKDNHAFVVSKSSRIRTLQQLIDAAEIDLDQWTISDWGVKKWEVGAKAEKKDLSWEDGKLDHGWVKTDGFHVEELWSVWAKLTARSPIKVYPVIAPVEVTTTYKVIEKPNTSGIYRTLVGSDPHFGFSKDQITGHLEPYHDRLALDLFLQVAAAEQPDAIYIIGDIFDNAAWSSKFIVTPDMEYTTQPAIVEAHWWLCQLRMACPSSKIVLHEGNHDDRMSKAVISNVRAAYGLRPADELDLPDIWSPARLLALRKLDIEWVEDYPSDRSWINDGVMLTHGDVARSGPGATVRAVVLDSTYSKIFGHIHSLEMASRTIDTKDGSSSIIALSTGCLCRIDGIVPAKTKSPDWQQGFVILDHDDTTMLSIYILPIQDGATVWDKREYIARDRVADLGSDNPGWRW